jgi:copper chaperone CopZ
MANGNTTTAGQLIQYKGGIPLATQKNSKESVYHVGGLKGDHCRDRIEHTLSHLHGVSSVQVDLASKQVTVNHDESITSSGYIEETLQSLGYSVLS